MGSERLQQGSAGITSVQLEPDHTPATAGPTDTIEGDKGDFHITYRGMPVCAACSAHEGIAALLGKHGVHKFRCAYSSFGQAADAALLARNDGFDVTVEVGACPFQGV